MFNVVQRFSFCSMFSVVQCSFFNIDSHFLSRLSDPGPTALLKLADFGVAFECLTKRAAGTPNYMPLAVLEGKGPADKFMDTYASACTLYEMVEGSLMVENPEGERPPPNLQNKTMWGHNGKILLNVFNALHEMKEGRNSNWAGWLNLRKAIKILLCVDWTTGHVETWTRLLSYFGFWFLVIFVFFAGTNENVGQNDSQRIVRFLNCRL